MDELDENISDTEYCAGNEKAEKTAGFLAQQSISSGSPKNGAVMEHVGESVSMAELLSMIKKMSITIIYLNEQFNSLGEEIRQMKKQPSLLIDEEETNDDDLPFLAKMEAFNSPISERDQLEQLENVLKADKSFYLFFVSQCHQYF